MDQVTDARLEELANGAEGDARDMALELLSFRQKRRELAAGARRRNASAALAQHVRGLLKAGLAATGSKEVLWADMADFNEATIVISLPGHRYYACEIVEM